VALNAITETQLPAPAEGAALVIERAVAAPAVEGKPAETRYEAVGEISRAAGARSSLILLQNPLGRRYWEGVKPSVIDTSSSRVPPGSILLMNLCAEPVDAVVGGRGGQLAGGQSALVAVAAPGGAPLELRLALRRGAEPIQLFDSARAMPASRRALLIVHPVATARNARGADFLLLPLSADPEPPPVPAVPAGR
jgi:hypothetical protein